jgi:signal transduction histidine kinase
MFRLKIHKNSFTYKAIKSFTLFTLSLSFLFFAIDISSKFDKHSKSKEILLNNIRIRFIPVISLSLWNLNTDYAKSLITAIHQYPLINEVQLYGKNENLIFETKKKEKNNSSKSISISLYSPNKTNSFFIGKLKFKMSDRPFKEDLIQNIWFLFFSRMNKSILLAIFIYIFVNKFLIKPLKKTIEKLDFKNKDLIEINNSDPTEIRSLISSINELKSQNNKYIFEINSNRKKLEHSNKSLQSEQEKVRKNISLFLHDSIGQELASLKLSSQVNNLNKDHIKLIDSIIKSTKELSYDILPASIGGQSFTEGLKWLIDSNSEEINYTQCILEDIETFSLSTKINLYRIIQELVQNSIRHSNVTEITIIIESIDDQYRLTYESEGEKKNVKGPTFRSGLGLISINERIEYISGSKPTISNKEDKYVFEFYFFNS